MPQNTRREKPSFETTADSASFGTQLAKSPLLWGGMMTAGFYMSLPSMPAFQKLVEQYVCDHPMQYTTTTLFFVGIAMLLVKAWGLQADKSAMREESFLESELPARSNCVARAEEIGDRQRALPSWIRQTHLAHRVCAACSYVCNRGSSEGLDEHLQYLARQSTDRARAAYSLLNTVVWAMLLIGCLGTVMGMTTAAGNFNMKEYEASTTSLVGQVAAAFDTTTISMALSLGLMLCKVLVQHREQETLQRVDDYGRIRILSVFPPERTSTGSAFSDAEAAAAQQLLDRTDSMIARQTELWEESLEAIRERWGETLQKQKLSFDETLRQGQVAALQDHSNQLARVREEFLQAFVNVAQELRNSLEETRETQAHLQQTFQQQIGELWLQVRHDLKVTREEDSAQRAQLLDAIAKTVGQWQQQLSDANEGAVEQLEELRLQREAIFQMVQGEQQLGQLQGRLTDNLVAIRTSQAFEETLHSLNAAVHLLTTRVRPKAA